MVRTETVPRWPVRCPQGLCPLGGLRLASPAPVGPRSPLAWLPLASALVKHLSELTTAGVRSFDPRKSRRRLDPELCFLAAVVVHSTVCSSAFQNVPSGTFAPAQKHLTAWLARSAPQLPDLDAP